MCGGRIRVSSGTARAPLPPLARPRSPRHRLGQAVAWLIRTRAGTKKREGGDTPPPLPPPRRRRSCCLGAALCSYPDTSHTLAFPLHRSSPAPSSWRPGRVWPTRRRGWRCRYDEERERGLAKKKRLVTERRRYSIFRHAAPRPRPGTRPRTRCLRVGRVLDRSLRWRLASFRPLPAPPRARSHSPTATLTCRSRFSPPLPSALRPRPARPGHPAGAVVRLHPPRHGRRSGPRGRPVRGGQGLVAQPPRRAAPGGRAQAGAGPPQPGPVLGHLLLQAGRGRGRGGSGLVSFWRAEGAERGRARASERATDVLFFSRW